MTTTRMTPQQVKIADKIDALLEEACVLAHKGRKAEARTILDQVDRIIAKHHPYGETGIGADT